MKARNEERPLFLKEAIPLIRFTTLLAEDPGLPNTAHTRSEKKIMF